MISSRIFSIIKQWHQSWPQFSYWLVWIGFLALGLKTATAYPEFVAAHFWGLSLWQVAGLVWLITTGWQLIWRLKFSSRECRGLAGITTIFLLMITILYFYQAQAPILNAALVTFGWHLEVLLTLSVILVTLTLYHLLIIKTQKLPEKWWLIVGGCAALLLLAYSLDLDFFIWLGTEDMLFEWLSFGVTVLGAVIAIILGLGSWRQQPRRFGKILAFGIWTVVLIFLAGEEVSWGQRALALETTGIFAVANQQQEINFHNLAGIHQTLALAYFMLGLWGSGSWLWHWPAVDTWRHQHWPQPLNYLLDNFAFSLTDAPWFLPLLLYGGRVFFTEPLYYKTWEEFAELLAWTGMMLYLSRQFDQRGRLSWLRIHALSIK
jgi:hypothetical protein